MSTSSSNDKITQRSAQVAPKESGRPRRRLRRLAAVVLFLSPLAVVSSAQPAAAAATVTGCFYTPPAPTKGSYGGSPADHAPTYLYYWDKGRRQWVPAGYWSRATDHRGCVSYDVTRVNVGDWVFRDFSNEYVTIRMYKRDFMYHYDAWTPHYAPPGYGGYHLGTGTAYCLGIVC